MSKMTRREVMALGATGAGYALMGGLAPGRLWGAPEGPAKGKQNVLFIAVDDLRPQLGCYGHRQMLSPNIDRFAESGTLFERAYCQQAVCAASRSSLLSGCRPDTTRVWDLQTPLRTTLPNVITLPEHFRQNGYFTASLSKIYHHGKKDDPKAWSEDPWFPATGPMSYATEESIALGQRDWEASDRSKPRTQFRGPACESTEAPESRYGDSQTADQAIAMLRRLQGQRFFLATGFIRPHLPFVCPKRYWDLYQREKIDLADNPFKPKGCPDIAMHSWGELRSYHGIPKQGPVSEAQARELVHGYYACVSFVDAQIGRVLQALDELGLRDNTVVVLWGDHGWNLGEHGLWCKHCNFETSVHSPLMLRAPGFRAGQRSPALSEFVDIYPTLCELCGLSLPETLEGTSLVPLLQEPKRPWKDAAFSQYPRGRVMGYSMKTDRYRYTEWLPRGADQPVGRELYDHEKDPGENVSLAELPEQKGVVDALAAKLRAGWRGARPRV